MQVLDWELQRQLAPYMKQQIPLPGIYDPDFIAANQDTRADNIIKGTRSEQVERVRHQIRTFKEENKVDKVSQDMPFAASLVVIAYQQVCRVLQPYKQQTVDSATMLHALAPPCCTV